MRAVGEPADDAGGDGESEIDRLRRHLRALAAVNRQLFAQLEGTGGRAVAAAPDGDLLAEEQVRMPVVAIRRLGPATEMVEQLAAGSGGSPPFLVRSASLGGWVVEGRSRRVVKARILYDALAGVLEERTLPDAEISRLAEAAPVEVLEGPSGPAFVVVGGRSYPLRGLPLPYPVTHDQMARFPKGPEIRVRGATPVVTGLRGVAGRVRRSLRRR